MILDYIELHCVLMKGKVEKLIKKTESLILK